MLILNEKKYVEDLLKSHKYEKNPYFDLRLFAVYLRQYDYMTDLEMTELLISELKDYCSEQYYKKQVKWNSICEKLVKTTKKAKLVEIDCVPITRKEIETIKSINDFRVERLAFTMLVMAKYNHIVNPMNDGWVNYEDKIIFDYANIRCKVEDRTTMLGKLYKLGLIELPKKISVRNERITFIDDSNEDIVLNITDTRRLGMQYQNFIGDGKFIFCERCGLIVKDGTRRHKKYCSICAKDVDLEKAKERYVRNKQLL